MKYFICNMYIKLKKKITRLCIVLYLHGIMSLIDRIIFKRSLNKLDYLYWIEHCEKKQDFNQINKQISKFVRRPTIGIVILIYNPEINYLMQTIDSVINQYYQNWKLYLVINGNHDKKYEKFLKEKEKNNKKIKCYFLKNNLGISEATNFIVSKIETEYIGFLDHDDLLKPETLFEYIKIINNNINVDLLYCDEDKINFCNIREQPMFKSAWGPDSLRTYMYINHFIVIKKNIFLKAGGFNKKFDGCQDYELLLRVSNITDDIFHAPYILYHWRMSSTSTSTDINNKPYAYKRYIKSKYEFLQNYSINLVQKPKQYATEIKYIFSKRSTHVIFTCINMKYFDSISYMLKLIKKTCNFVTYTILLNKKYKNLVDLDTVLYKFRDCSEIYFYSQNDVYKIYNKVIKKHVKDIFIFVENGTYLNYGDISDIINHSILEKAGAITGLILHDKSTIKCAGVNFIPKTKKFKSMFQEEEISKDFVNAKVSLTENILSVNTSFMCITREKLQLINGFNDIYYSNKYIILDLNLRLLLKGKFNVKRGDVTFISKLNCNKYGIGYKNISQENRDLSTILSRYEDIILNRFMYYNKNLCSKYLDYSIDLFNVQH